MNLKKWMAAGLAILVLGMSVTGCGKETQQENGKEDSASSSQTQLVAVEEQPALEAEMEAEKAAEMQSETEAAPETADSSQATEEPVAETNVEPTPEPTAEPTPVPVEVTAFETPQVRYATSSLNIRKGPGTEYEVMGRLALAQEIQATGQAENGWYELMVGEEKGYVSGDYISEEPVVIPTPEPTAEPAPQPAVEPAPQPVAEPTPQPAAPATPQPAPQTPAPPAVVTAPAGVIMVGDSRCVQMKDAVGGGGCMWFCENSKGYKWLVEKALPAMDKHVGAGTKVVINLGVNDPENCKSYADLINGKAAEWAQRGATTYYVTVNPVWDNPYTTREEVAAFNTNMPGWLSGVVWVDTYSSLMEGGCKIVDGLHYDTQTSINIFNMIMGKIS